MSRSTNPSRSQPPTVSKLKLDLEAMRKFKRILHGSAPAVFQTFSKKQQRSTADGKAMRMSLSQANAETLVKANIEGLHVAMTVNSLRGDRRRNEDVTRINAVFIDSDDGNISPSMLLKLPVPPHFIVKTSEKKLHAYWLLKHCTVADFKTLQKSLAKKFGTDPSVCDPARAMRMPGTYNHKYQPPFLAKLIHCDEDRSAVSVKHLIKQLDLFIPRQPGSTVEASCTESKDTTPDDALLSQIDAALKAIPAEERSIWLRVGMALHSHDSGPNGFSRWDEWSRRTTRENYDANDQRSTWDNFKPSGITIGTLFYLARQAAGTTTAEIDESAMAELFAQTFSNKLRHDPQTRKWYEFDGTVWKADAQAPIRCAREMIETLKTTVSPANRAAYKRFQSVSGFKSIVGHAELLPSLIVTASQFDRNADLLAVENGVLNLSTGMFRPATPEDMLRRRANVTYTPVSQCPTWMAFMRAITRDRRELYEYIREAIGYTLFGHTREQVFFLLYGSGRNGKGALMHTINRLLGDYSADVSPSLLTKAYSGSPNGPSPAIAVLQGARMVTCTELSTSSKLDDAFIKQISGGDALSARAVYGDQVTFEPEGTLWISTNSVPQVASEDDAMWRRLRVLPFDAVFSGEARDPDLEVKLQAELPGILNWVLKGAMSYAKRGKLPECAIVKNMERRLRKEADPVLSWLVACTKKSASSKARSSTAYESYVRFMRREDRKPLSTSQFRAKLENKGIEHVRARDANYFRGLRLIE